MIRIKHQSPRRLVLSDAQHSGFVWAIAGFFLLATVILWGAAPTLGPFGIGFALIWTAMFVFMFSHIDWVRAEFDADSNTLEITQGRLYRPARHVRHDLGGLGEPVRLDGLPEKLPKVRIGHVIRDWRAQARDA